MEIKLHKDVPPILVRQIARLGEEIKSVKQVIIDADVDPKLMHGRMGVWVADTGSIITDIGACIKNTQWFQYGVFFHWNAWLNMLWVVYHEFAHAEQSENDDCAGRDIHELEELATEWALDDVLDFVTKHPILPPLNEWGWAKTLLQKCVNDLYWQHADVFNEEFSCLGTPAAANAIIAARTSGGFDEVKSVVRLIHRITEGKEVGTVINKTPYLTARDVICMATAEHKCPIDTIYMGG